MSIFEDAICNPSAKTRQSALDVLNTCAIHDCRCVAVCQFQLFYFYFLLEFAPLSRMKDFCQWNFFFFLFLLFLLFLLLLDRISVVRTFILGQAPTYGLLNELIRRVLEDTEMGVKGHTAEIIRRLVDPEGMDQVGTLARTPSCTPFLSPKHSLHFSTNFLHSALLNVFMIIYSV
jgi:hypothetical protein